MIKSDNIKVKHKIMANLGHIIFYSLAGGLFSLAGGLLLLSRKKMADRLASYATPFAAGALLAAAFLDLLPEGLRETEPSTVMLAALLGIIIFFFAERFLHWFHHHHPHSEDTADPSRSLIIAGDIMHNALDGVAIAASFLISVPTGIVTTMAVAAHEIPQEISDFGILLRKGMSRRKVLIVNALSALATTLAAVVTFVLGDAEQLPVGVLLGLSAGFLLYIALSDLIPSIHEEISSKRLFGLQPLLLIAGIIVVGLAITLTHDLIEARGTDHDHGRTSSNQDHTEGHAHDPEAHQLDAIAPSEQPSGSTGPVPVDELGHDDEPGSTH